MAEATRQDDQTGELNEAIGFLKLIEAQGTDEQGIYIKCFLMAGRSNDVFAISKGEKSVGWSYGSNAGIVSGAVLSALTDHSEKATTVQELFRGYANQRSIYSNMFSVEYGMDGFDKEIIMGLVQEKLSKAKRDEYLAWVEKIGKRRIDHIVSNKYRNAYDRAAQVLCSLAELFMVMDRDDRAKRLLRHYYNDKYNRFSAFKREVKKVMGSSALLKNLNF